jgi:hypothetical protein
VDQRHQWATLSGGFTSCYVGHQLTVRRCNSATVQQCKTKKYREYGLEQRFSNPLSKAIVTNMGQPLHLEQPQTKPALDTLKCLPGKYLLYGVLFQSYTFTGLLHPHAHRGSRTSQ